MELYISVQYNNIQNRIEQYITYSTALYSPLMYKVEQSITTQYRKVQYSKLQ